MSKLKKQAISKTSFGIAKTFASQLVSKNEKDSADADDEAALRVLEEEVMWDRNATNKSEVVERNLTQMIDVLHLRLKSLEHVVSVRQGLCNEDIDPGSSNMSKQAPKIADDFEEINPRVLKDPRAHLHKVIFFFL
jgi:hypothetical protein